MSTTISTRSLEGSLWTLAGTATLITIGRYIIRYRVRGKFYWDDLAHLFAWALMVGCCAVFQDTFPIAEQLIGVSNPAPEIVIAFRKHQEALTMLLILSLWGVKFAFMFLYRLLFWASPIFQRLWWIVMVILIVTVWVPIAGNLTECGPVSDIYNPQACEAHIQYQQTLLEYVCGVHVGTDFLVMTLPWYIIRRIQISTAKKIGIGAIFSVVLITIACDILRTIKSFDQGAFSDSSLYTFLEVTLAVIVSCMPVYRALFRVSKNKGANKNTGGAFVPISGETEQRILTGTKAPIPSPDERRQGTRARHSWRPSSKFFQNKRGNTEPKSDQQHLTPLTLQELPSVHFRSVDRSGADASSLV